MAKSKCEKDQINYYSGVWNIIQLVTYKYKILITQQLQG